MAKLNNKKRDEFQHISKGGGGVPVWSRTRYPPLDSGTSRLEAQWKAWLSEISASQEIPHKGNHHQMDSGPAPLCQGHG